MIRFDAENNIEEYTLVLSKKNHHHFGQIINTSEVVSKENMNAANEISFTVYKYNDYEDSEIEPLWDEITDFKYIYVVELDEYYEITVELNDGENIYKTVTGTSACECELSQSYIYGLEINTEADIAREEYKNPTIFYKPDNPEESLLHRALYKLPNYSIKHVDNSLVNIQRTFSADGEDVYSFLTGTVAEEIKCLFVFDSVDRTISVYDLNTVCLDCGYRGEYSDECPKCHSKNLKYYGEDTTIYVDTENLAEDISFVVDTDSVKNCFKLEAGDDNMTAAVTNLNPNGSGYIYYFSDEQKHDMSDELVQKMDDYDKLNESYKPEYSEVMKSMYEAIDKIVYYTSSMMPTRENEPTDAKKEAAKLTEANLSPIGLPTVASSTSTATVNTALKNYIKVYVNSGKFKIEVNEGEFVYEGLDMEEYNYGYWYGNFRITNYSDEEDTAISESIKVKVHDSYQDFLEQKIKKKLAESNDEEGSVFDVLSIEDLIQFKEALTLYCLNRLISFNDAIQGVIDIMIEADQAREGASFYEDLYLPYRNKLEACQSEMDVRSATIDIYEEQLETAQKRQQEIQGILDFEKYLGDDLYKEFCCHRREDIYSNENYVSDGLSNDEIFKRAEEFVEEAEKELIKSGEYQHTISSNLTNLLVMEEFQPLKEKFALGNFIRIGIDGKIYRLRLISYQISFDSITNIDVDFSDVTKIRDGVTDLEGILNQASSMASSYDSIAHQVDKSKESDEMVRQWFENGLDLTNMKIIAGASNQNFVQDKNGLLIRSYDDIAEDFSPEQMKLVNATLAITDDGWKTIKAAIGRYYYTDPLTGETTKAYGVNAETLIGKIILGNNLGIYSEDAYSSMTFDNRGLILNANKGADNQYDRIIDIKIDGKSKFYVDRNGDLVINNGQIGTIDESLEKVINRVSSLETGLDGFKSEVSSTYSTKSEITLAKNEAISTASQDATTKANNAKNEAISAANRDTDTKLLSYSTTEQTKSLINQSADNIKLEVSKTYSSKQEIIDVKNEVISTAAADATTKADQAKNDAINTSNIATDEKLKKYYTSEQVDSAISLGLQSIDLSIFYTKTETTEVISTAKSEVISTASADATNKSNQAKNEAILSASQDATAKANAAKDAAISESALDATSKANQAKNDAILAANADTDEKLKKYYTSEQVDTAIKLGIGNINLSVYYTKTEVTEVVNTAKSDAISTASSDATSKANAAKSEAINTASVDATNKANSAKTEAINTAALDATAKSESAKNEAISTAAQDATSKANQAKNDAIADTDEKLKSYSTTVEMKSAINLSADGITSTVEKTYATKDSLTGKVDKNSIISSINQTAEEIKIQAGKIKFEGLVTANENFKILEDGSINAQNGTFSGTISGSEIYGGLISGTEIDGTSIILYDKEGVVPAVTLQNNAINFYDWGDGSGAFIGSIYSGVISNSDQQGVLASVLGITHEEKGRVIIGYKTDDSSPTNYHYIKFDNNYGTYPIEIYRGIGVFNNMDIKDNCGITFTNGSYIFDSVTPYFELNGANDIFFASNGGSTSQMIIHRDSISVWKLFKVNGDLTVTGSKNRVVETNNYGNILMNAVESTSCLFEDNGSGQLNNDGVCIIFFDDIFAETVNLNCDYYIQITKYGQGDIYISDKYHDYFIVKGTPNLVFDWNVKAKQKGYETSRMNTSFGFESPSGGIENINNNALHQQQLSEKNKIDELNHYYNNYIDGLYGG